MMTDAEREAVEFMETALRAAIAVLHHNGSTFTLKMCRRAIEAYHKTQERREGAS